MGKELLRGGMRARGKEKKKKKKKKKKKRITKMPDLKKNESDKMSGGGEKKKRRSGMDQVKIRFHRARGRKKRVRVASRGLRKSSEGRMSGAAENTSNEGVIQKGDRMSD